MTCFICFDSEKRYSFAICNKQLSMFSIPLQTLIATIGIVDVTTIKIAGFPLKPNHTNAKTTHETGGTV